MSSLSCVSVPSDQVSSSGSLPRPSSSDQLSMARPDELPAELPDGTVWNDAPEYEMFGPEPDVEWLWPKRIPLGMVTLIEGAEGAGKSFVALDLAARVSRGAPWPDELLVADAASIDEPRTVASIDEAVESGGHDDAAKQPDQDPVSLDSHGMRSGGRRQPVPLMRQDAASTLPDVMVLCRQSESSAVGRRLAGLGADFQRIRRLRSVGADDAEQNRDGDQAAVFPADLPVIERELARGSFRLVLIDSLADFCHKPQHVAEALERLNELAERYQVAILVTLPAHCRIDGQGMLRVTSRWRTGGARCVWCVVADPEDPARRVFMSRRTNFCEEPDGLELRLEQGRVVWRPDLAVDPADPLGQHVAVQDCLKAILRNQCQPAPVVYRLGGQCGFNPKQLRAAARRLGIESHRTEGFGGDGAWVWYTAEQRAEVLANVRELADECDRENAAFQARHGSRDGQQAAMSYAETQGPSRLAGPFWIQPDGSLVRPVLRTMPVEKGGEEPRDGSISAGAAPSPGTDPGLCEAGETKNSKSEESLEKQGEFRQADRAQSQSPLPRDRYARRQERKRRMREMQTAQAGHR